jgi:hypothetical protein
MSTCTEPAGKGRGLRSWGRAHLLPNLDDGCPCIVGGDAVAVGALEAVYHQLNRERLLQNHAAEDLLLDGELHLRMGSGVREVGGAPVQSCLQATRVGFGPDE